ncbi:tetratricopeptide repeat protein [Streptomyces collinus]|uniref:tetratricopeptide repeat protein n=1 Tax=Streptomyces collinus TaxID=42684 RepID=UPI003317E0E8
MQLRTEIALAMQDAGEPGRALDELLSISDGYRRVVGHEDILTLTAEVNLAAAYQSVGKYEDSIGILRRALPALKRAAGNDSPVTLAAKNNLGSGLRAVGEYDKAISLLREAVEGYEQILGAHHPETLAVRNNLASLYLAKGDMRNAQSAFEKAVSGYRDTLGPYNVDTLRAMNNLALVYSRNGRPDLAAQLYDSVLTVRRKFYSETDAEIRHAVVNLASVYESVGEYGQALNLLLRHLDAYKHLPDRSVGEEEWALKLRVLAVYKRQGQFQDAIEFLHDEFVEPELRDLTPDEHAATLAIGAVIYFEAGRRAESADLLRRSRIAAESIPEGSPGGNLLDSAVKLVNATVDPSWRLTRRTGGENAS